MSSNKYPFILFLESTLVVSLSGIDTSTKESIYIDVIIVNSLLPAQLQTLLVISASLYAIRDKRRTGFTVVPVVLFASSFLLFRTVLCCCLITDGLMNNVLCEVVALSY